MSDVVTIDWSTLRGTVLRMIAERHPGGAPLVLWDQKYRAVMGVPTGGCFPAVLFNLATGIPLLEGPLDPGDLRPPAAARVLVLDDLVDSGATLRPWAEAGHPVDALYRKPHSPPDLAPGATVIEGWLRFPWEHDDLPLDLATRLCQRVDPTVDVTLGMAEAVRSYAADLLDHHRDRQEHVG